MTNWAEKHKNIYGYIDENAYLTVNYKLIVKSEETFRLTDCQLPIERALWSEGWQLNKVQLCKYTI